MSLSGIAPFYKHDSSGIMRPMQSRILAVAVASFAVACSAPPKPAPQEPTVVPTEPAPTEQVDLPEEPLDAAALAKQLSCEERESGWGCVDTSGKTVIPFEYLQMGPFSEAGICAVMHPDKGYQYLDATGAFLYEAQPYDNAPDPLQEGRARFIQDGKVGYLGEDFTIVIPARYDSAMPFRDGKARVCVGCDTRVWNKDAPENLPTGRVFYIDKQGNEVDAP